MQTAVRLFLMLTVLSFVGCVKDPEVEDPGPLLIPQEIKDYIFFKPGTYWVYIDSVSGRVDSMYVYETAHSFDTLTLTSHPKMVYEIFVVKAHSAMDGYNYYFEVNTTYSVNNNYYFNVFEEKLKPGDYKGRTILFNYKPKIDEIIYYLNSQLVVKDILGTYSLNGYLFKDVIKIFHDLSGVEVSNNVTNYIAKNYGIVRKELADSNQVWNLARSNIIQ